MSNNIAKLGILGLGIFSAAVALALPQKKMNVLFIAVDDLKLTIPTPSHLDGASLVAAIDKPKSELRTYAFSQYPRGKGIMGYTIRTKHYRYTEWIGGKYDCSCPYDKTLVVAREMYDYLKDPLETRSVIDLKAYADAQAEMEKLFVEAMNREHAQCETYQNSQAFFALKLM